METKVKKIMAEILEVREAEINSATSLEELGADSLDVIEIIFGIEREFNIDISDEDADNLRTLGDIVKYLEGKINR